MVVIGPVITAEVVALAGVTGDLAAALTGLTWSEARKTVAAILLLVGSNEAIKGGAVTTYQINGRNVSLSYQALTAALEFINKAHQHLSSTGGIRSIPIELRGD